MSVSKKKYISKSVLLDQFGQIVVRLEKDFGVIVGVDRCRSITGGRFSYTLFINGLSHKQDSLRDVVQFLEGYKCAMLETKEKKG